jgi:hypothetical protein
VDWVKKKFPLAHPVFGELEAMCFAYAILAPPDQSYRFFQRKRPAQPGVDVDLPLVLAEQKLVVSIRVDMKVLAVLF